eukprot:748726-Hanusia_phi.AAC.4
MKMRKSEEKKIILDMLMDISPETEELEREAFEFIEKKLTSRSATIQRSRSDDAVLLLAKGDDTERKQTLIPIMRCISCDSPSGATSKKVMDIVNIPVHLPREDNWKPGLNHQDSSGRRKSSTRSNSIVTEPERLLKCYLNVF